MRIIINFKRDEGPKIENKIDKGLFSVCNACKWRKPKRPCAARYHNFYYNNIRQGQTKLKKMGLVLVFQLYRTQTYSVGMSRKGTHSPSPSSPPPPMRPLLFAISVYGSLTMGKKKIFLFFETHYSSHLSIVCPFFPHLKLLELEEERE